METIQKEFPLLYLWFQLLGCSLLPVQRIIYSTALTFLAFLAFLGEAIGFTNRTSIQEQVEMLFNIGLLLYFGFIHLAIRSHYDQISQVLTTICTPKGSDLQLMVFKRTLQKVSQVVPKVLVIFASLMVLGLFQWCSAPLFDEFDYKNKNFHVGPFLYQCGEDGANKFPISSMCLTMDSWAQYTFANSLLTLLAFWGCIGHAWTFAFFVSVCIFVETNVSVVEERLQQLQRRACIVDGLPVAPGSSLLFEGLWEVALRNEFVKIIQYYQYLGR